MRLIKMTDSEIVDFIKNLLKGDEGYDKSWRFK
jgi:hypothetical protein